MNAEFIAYYRVSTSPNIKALIGDGTWLKVYAKTTRRVRFEIELKASIIGKKAEGQTAPTRHELSQKTRPLVAYATSKLNQVLPTLLAPPLPRSNVPALQLMTEVNTVCDGAHTAEAILGALSTFGRVTLYNNSPFKEPVHALKEKGILRTAVPHSRNYVVTDEYVPALDQIRAMVVPPDPND